MPRSPKAPPPPPTSSSRASTRCGSKPRPSSNTVRAIDRPRRSTLTRCRVAPECRWPFASASCRIRYRDLRGEGAVAQLPGQLQLHRLLRQRLVLDGKALDDLAQFAALEPGGAEGADEVADLAERALEQPHRLPGALRGGRVRRERTLEHLELRQGGENVLYRPVVHVEHDALQLALTGREEAPRGGASLGVPNLGHPRPGGSACRIRSATNPSAAPTASAAATRTPPSGVAARRPMATPAPANAPAV